MHRALILALTFALSATAQNKQKIYHLVIGDPEHRDREAPVVLDAITDTVPHADTRPD